MKEQYLTATRNWSAAKTTFERRRLEVKSVERRIATLEGSAVNGTLEETVADELDRARTKLHFAIKDAHDAREAVEEAEAFMKVAYQEMKIEMEMLTHE